MSVFLKFCFGRTVYKEITKAFMKNDVLNHPENPICAFVDALLDREDLTKNFRSLYFTSEKARFDNAACYGLHQRALHVVRELFWFSFHGGVSLYCELKKVAEDLDEEKNNFDMNPKFFLFSMTILVKNR